MARHRPARPGHKRRHLRASIAAVSGAALIAFGAQHPGIADHAIKAHARPVSAPRSASIGTAVHAAANLDHQVLKLTNAERARHGCAPLRGNPKLAASAAVHTLDMAQHGVLQHPSSNGQDWAQRIATYYPGWQSLGENVASGFSTPSSVMIAWIHSPEHEANIINCRFTLIGIAHYAGYWDQDFAR